MQDGTARGCYRSWICNRCGRHSSAERWWCGQCRDDFCFNCEADIRVSTIGGGSGGSSSGGGGGHSLVPADWPVTGPVDFDIEASVAPTGSAAVAAGGDSSTLASPSSRELVSLRRRSSAAVGTIVASLQRHIEREGGDDEGSGGRSGGRRIHRRRRSENATSAPASSSAAAAAAAAAAVADAARGIRLPDWFDAFMKAAASLPSRIDGATAKAAAFAVSAAAASAASATASSSAGEAVGGSSSGVVALPQQPLYPVNFAKEMWLQQEVSLSGRHLSIECVASNPMVSFDSLIHFSGLLDFFFQYDIVFRFTTSGSTGSR